MSKKPDEPSQNNKKNSKKKGLSTFTKVMLSILLLLTICVAGFIFHAWQVLNKPIENNTTVQAASIEVLTPAGASTNPNAPTTFVPNTVTMAASDQTLSASATDTLNIATTPTKPVDSKPQNTDVDNNVQPILPTNVPATTTSLDSPRPSKPKPTNGTTDKQLDNLF